MHLENKLKSLKKLVIDKVLTMSHNLENIWGQFLNQSNYPVYI